MSKAAPVNPSSCAIPVVIAPVGGSLDAYVGGSFPVAIAHVGGSLDAPVGGSLDTIAASSTVYPSVVVSSSAIPVVSSMASSPWHPVLLWSM